MGKEKNSGLDNFTEQTIFYFLLTDFFPQSTPKFVGCEIFNISVKD